jgi:ABC-2 type transport system permease protein
MVSLGIGTGFERQYHVLKRLGATPLGRPRLIAAKITMVVAIEALQFVLLVVAAMALGWRPTGNTVLAVPAVIAGTAAFAGIGLLMAGTLRGTVTLALANALYIVLLLLGGMIVPLDELPGPIAKVAELLPAAALSEVMGEAFTAGATASASAWAVLVAWAIAAPIVAAATFRWD